VVLVRNVRAEWIANLSSSFRSKAPGLHFISGQLTITHPAPLLAVAVLYVATAHYPTREYADYQAVYFEAFGRAVGALALPQSRANDRFDNVLGIILVSLLSIGWVDSVGMWIGLAYRQLLDGVMDLSVTPRSKWNSMWEGLRVSGPGKIMWLKWRSRRSNSKMHHCTFLYSPYLPLPRTMHTMALRKVALKKRRDRI
jgi:hypothetical protein